MSGPLEQFQIKTIVPLEFAGYDISFTNSSLYMMIGLLTLSILLFISLTQKYLFPNRVQAISEICYEFIANMLKENAGKDAIKFFPFVFTLFMFILFGNCVGMIPGSFTYTSHIIVTFAMAFGVFIIVTIVGFVKHGLHFFTFFVPQGTSIFLAPIIIPIEVLSYLSRPVSLSIRLFANMMAGHTMMKVFAGFSVSLGAAFGIGGYLMGVLPIVINVGLIGFEFLVAFLQAYVFTILTCLYLKDAIELH